MRKQTYNLPDFRIFPVALFPPCVTTFWYQLIHHILLFITKEIGLEKRRNAIRKLELTFKEYTTTLCHLLSLDTTYHPS